MTDSAIALERDASPAVVSETGGQLPPVLILNLFYTGLGIARALASHGMRLIGLSAHRQIYGNFTRFCEALRSPNSQEEPEQLVEFLLKYAAKFKGAVIFPTRDADVLFLDRFREELQPTYRLAIPPRQVLRNVINKDLLVQAAIQAGVPVPRTLLVRNGADLRRVGEVVGFPCVLKPVSSVDWRRGDNWALAGGRKAFAAESAAELDEEYERLAKITPEVLVQEWIPGGVEDIVVLGGYVGEKSEPLGYFTARKIVQSPPDFGTGCVVESIAIPELLAPTLRLWRALGYRGMAEVEYKRDARDGRYKLIEINTRHWDWHQLGGASDVNLSWLAYQDLIGRTVSGVEPSICRAKWIAEDVLLRHCAENLYQTHRLIPQFWDKISGRRMYGIFKWNDPLPLVRYSFAVLIPDLFKAGVKKIRRGVVAC